MPLPLVLALCVVSLVDDIVVDVVVVDLVTIVDSILAVVILLGVISKVVSWDSCSKVDIVFSSSTVVIAWGVVVFSSTCFAPKYFSLGGRNFVLPFLENLEILKLSLGSFTFGFAGLKPNGKPASLGLGALGLNKGLFEASSVCC